MAKVLIRVAKLTLRSVIERKVAPEGGLCDRQISVSHRAPLYQTEVICRNHTILRWPSTCSDVDIILYLISDSETGKDS